MKPMINCRVYILTDSRGEWWEYMGANGAASRFKPGTSELNDPKCFKDAKKAIAFVTASGYKYYKVVKLSPPVKPSRTWNEEILVENLPKEKCQEDFLIQSKTYDKNY